MIGRRRKAFHALVTLLRAVEADLNDFESVLTLNKLLVKEILRAEQNIQRHKASLKALKVRLKTGGLSRDETTKLRKAIARTDGYINGYRAQIYIWKCFGDGLAFAYLDKFAVKHAFFETESFNVKASAGMLMGKSGLSHELAFLESAISHKVPAVLCDVTNTLRYGDVCLLGNTDPYFFEVKSGARLNQRGERQRATLARLQDFFETDEAENFRSPGVTRRVAYSVPEYNHEAAMNNCIATAEREGFCIMQPEPGLTYVAVYTASPPLSWPISLTGRQVAYMLNDDKKAGAWLYYKPFTNTIREARHLLDFVEGRLVLMVSFDMQLLADRLSRPEWETSFHDDVPAAIQFTHRMTRAIAAVTWQFLARIGYDFASPTWIADSQAPRLEEIMSATEGVLTEPESTDILKTMFGRQMDNPLR